MKTALLACLFSAATAAASCLDDAAARMDAGDNAGALRAMEFCPADPSPEARGALARLHYLTGDLPRAKSFLKEDEDDPLLILTRAQVLFEEGRPEESLALFDRLLPSSPWRPLVFLYKGEVLEALGRDAEAEESYKKALAEDASFAEARPALARLAEKRGDAEAAWRQWDRVAAAAPKNKAAQDALDRLKPRISKTAEELRPPSRLASHRGAACDPSLWDGPFIKVGLATDGTGRPQPLKEAVFRASASFRATASDGRLLAEGAPGERWTVRAAEKGAALISPDGKRAGSFQGTLAIRPSPPSSSTIILDGLTHAPGFVWSGAADKEVRGDLEIAVRADGSLRLAARMPMEAYLYGVVGAEMPPTWPAEALNAQAVVARTYAEARRASHPHGKDGYDLCDEQHCQVYAGAAKEADTVRRAVDATRGKILTAYNRPARTPYASNCGGHGRGAGEVWGFGGADLVGLPEMEIPAGPWALRRWIMGSPAVPCRTSPYVPGSHHRWARTFDAAGIEAAARKIKDIGPLVRVDVPRRGKGGHVSSLRIVGEKGEILLQKDSDIRRFFGEGPLRSALYAVETEERKGRPRRVIVWGGGWGHGVGLCQAGAAGRAEAGETHEAILSHYFPAARPAPVSSGKH